MCLTVTVGRLLLGFYSFIWGAKSLPLFLSQALKTQPAAADALSLLRAIAKRRWCSEKNTLWTLWALRSLMLQLAWSPDIADSSFKLDNTQV